MGTRSFEGISLQWPKLFFSTLPKTLSLRFNSGPVYRGRISATRPTISSLQVHLDTTGSSGKIREIFRNVSAPHIQNLSLTLITEPRTQGGGTAYRPVSLVPQGAEALASLLSFPHPDPDPDPVFRVEVGCHLIRLA